MTVNDKKSRLGPPARRRSMREAFISQSEIEEVERPETTMFNIRLDSDLHRRLKRFAFEHEITMKEIVTELIEDFLDKHE